MKKTLSIVLLLCTISVSAQKLTYKMGQQVQINKTDDFLYAGNDDENFYIVRTEKEKKNTLGYLEGYSRSTLQRIFSKQLSVPTKNANEFYLNDIVFTNDVIRVFYGFYSDTEKARFVVVADFDKTGKLTGKAVEISKAEGTENSSGNHYVFYDKESANTLIFHTAMKKGYAANGLKPEIEAMVIDNNLKTMWSKTVIMTRGKSFDWENVAIDKGGNLYIRGRAWLNKITTNSTAEFITYNWKKGLVVEQKIETESGLEGGAFITDKQQHLYFVAIQGTKFVVEAGGIYVAKFNTNEAMFSSQNVTLFPKPAPGEKAKKENHLEYLQMVDLIVDDDNAIRIQLEGSNSKWICEIRIDATGGIKNMNFVDKIQEGELVADHNGAVALYQGTSTYYIYNEIPENFDKSTKEYKTVSTKLIQKGAASPSYAKVEADGTKEKKVLVQNNGSKYAFLRPRRSLRISNQEVISVYEQEEKISFISIKLE